MGAFRPEDHFRNLKGKQYLEVVWRIVWFHEEREKQAGSIRCHEVLHDPVTGLATFHATASYWVDRGDGSWVERVGEGNGSETRKDFGDYYEKAATKAIGRALANLGYGTQFAIELDEGLEAPGGTPAESPVARRQADDKAYMPTRDAEDREAARASAQAQRATAQAAQKPKDTTARAVAIQRAQDLLSRDPEAREKLPKPLEQQTDEQVQKTITWLVGRANAAKKGETFWTGPAHQGNGSAAAGSGDAAEVDAAEVDADVGSRTEELTAYVNDVDAHLQAMKGTRGPMTADQRGTWAALYTRGQALTSVDASTPAAEVPPTKFSSACALMVQSCLAELSGSEAGA